MDCGWEWQLSVIIPLHERREIERNNRLSAASRKPYYALLWGRNKRDWTAIDWGMSLLEIVNKGES